MMQPRTIRLALAAALFGAGACSNGAATTKAQAADSLKADSAGGLVVPPSEPYRPGNLSAQAALIVSLASDSASKAPARCTASGGDSTSSATTIFWLDGI